MTLVCVAPDASLEVWTLGIFWDVEPYFGMFGFSLTDPDTWGREVIGEL